MSTWAARRRGLAAIHKIEAVTCYLGEQSALMKSTVWQSANLFKSPETALNLHF